MVETIRLESGHTLTGIGGSNPSLSAIDSEVPPLKRLRHTFDPALANQDLSLFSVNFSFSGQGEEEKAFTEVV